MKNLERDVNSLKNYYTDKVNMIKKMMEEEESMSNHMFSLEAQHGCYHMFIGLLDDALKGELEEYIPNEGCLSKEALLKTK